MKLRNGKKYSSDLPEEVRIQLDVFLKDYCQCKNRQTYLTQCILDYGQHVNIYQIQLNELYVLLFLKELLLKTLSFENKEFVLILYAKNHNFDHILGG